MKIKFNLLILALLFVAFPSLASATNYVDIGLRIKESSGIKKIAVIDTASTETGTYSCFTYHEDSSSGIIGSLNLDCVTDAWYWPNNGTVRSDGQIRNCTQTFNDFVNYACPGGYTTKTVETGFCGPTNYSNATFSCSFTTTESSSLKIYKNSKQYSIALVPRDSVYATKTLVRLSDGSIKALRAY